MDKVNEYRQIVQEFLANFAKNDANAQLIFDLDRDRYLVMHNEWRGENRIYGCAMQLDIIDNQIWIQQNNTEIYVDRELIQRGVPPKDIILGFRSPSIRQLLAAAHK
jgi:XisI protein